MGGSSDPDDQYSDQISYEVMTVNLKTGDVGQVDDIIHGTRLPAAAASLNRIALCGGVSADRSRSYCQVYSPKHERCVSHKRAVASLQYLHLYAFT